VELELALGLAAAVGVAIENAGLHDRLQDLRLTEDRERIARDLHDTVIQRLFATGLTLQGTVPLVRSDPERASERIQVAVDDLDLTVKQVRSAIFGLEAARLSGAGLRGQVLEAAREVAGVLGFEPTGFVDGPIDTGVGEELSADLLATLGEALTNVARHARAGQVDVELIAEVDTVVLRVRDDGVGPPEGDPGTGNGLKNMAARAERHGGTMTFTAGRSEGAVLEWRARRT
jgi:signal transduction histidine kinase